MKIGCKMQLHLQYTPSVANRNQEGREMTTFIPPQTVESNTPPVSRQTSRESCLALTEEQLRKQEADRLFEAGVQWFLAVSATA